MHNMHVGRAACVQPNYCIGISCTNQQHHCKTKHHSKQIMEQQQQYSSEDEEGIVHDATTQYSRVGQGLVKIPSELQYMTRLTHINLHGNSISKLVYLDRLPLLQNLNCSSNRLTTVDTCLTRCTALRVLNLCSNQLQVCVCV